MRNKNLFRIVAFIVVMTIIGSNHLLHTSSSNRAMRATSIAKFPLPPKRQKQTPTAHDQQHQQSPPATQHPHAEHEEQEQQHHHTTTTEPSSVLDQFPRVAQATAIPLIPSPNGNIHIGGGSGGEQRQTHSWESEVKKKGQTTGGMVPGLLVLADAAPKPETEVEEVLNESNDGGGGDKKQAVAVSKYLVLHVCSGNNEDNDGGGAAASSFGEEPADDLVERFFNGLHAAAVAEDFTHTLRHEGIVVVFKKGPRKADQLCHISVAASSFSSSSGSAANKHSAYGLILTTQQDDASMSGGRRRQSTMSLKIKASSPIGVMYALYTYLQLNFNISSEWSSTGTENGVKSAGISPTRSLRNFIPRVDIDYDEPKKEWRGQHFDTARHFYGNGYIKTILRRMTMLKMNKFHMHLTDEQGWRVESKLFPELHLVGGTRGPTLNGHSFKKYSGSKAYPTPMYHSQADIKELLQFAAARGIEIIPEIDLPAHAFALVSAMNKHYAANRSSSSSSSSAASVTTSIGSVLPASRVNSDCTNAPEGYMGALNCMGGVFGLVDPTKQSIEVLKSILGEVCQVFNQQDAKRNNQPENEKHFHLGGDEAEFARDQLWGGKTFDGVKVTNTGRTQSQLMQELITFIQKDCKRTPIVWDETILEAEGYFVPELPAKVMIWRDDRKSLKDLQKAFRAKNRELPVIYTPKTRLYFDYLQHAKVTENKFWPLQRPSTSAHHKAVSLRRAFEAHEHDAGFLIGYQSCLWTELVLSQEIAEYQLFPRLFATADVGWSDYKGILSGAENGGGSASKEVQSALYHRFRRWALQLEVFFHSQ